MSEEEVYMDKDGIEMEPIYCADCRTILGFGNPEDIDGMFFEVWCEDCGDIKLRPKKEKSK